MLTMQTRVRTGAIRVRAADDPRTIRAILNTEDEASDGLTLLVSGMDASRHLRSRTVLFDHDSATPIARTLSLTNLGSPRRTEATIQFPAAGISPKADETLGLIRSGVLNSMSIGFVIDKPPEIRAGRRVVTQWSLIEASVVACPALPSAEIIERGARFDPGHVRRALEADALRRRWDGDPTHEPMTQAEAFAAAMRRAAEARRLARCP
jgi:HK97 family phage prohead protease